MKINVKQMIPTSADSNLFVFETCKLGIGTSRRDHKRFIPFFNFNKPVLQCTRSLGRSIFYHCPVMFLKLACANLFNHTREGLGGFCKEYHARHGPVKSMDNTAIYIPRLVVAFLDERLHQLGQRGIAGFVALGNLSWQLVQRQQMIIFV